METEWCKKNHVYLRASYCNHNGKERPTNTIHILELKKSFIRHMLELPNITLTAFLIAFVIAFALSIVQGSYASAVGCFLTVASILPIKYMAWKRSKNPTAENKQKVIVIKRK
jgi:hypothetical protein